MRRFILLFAIVLLSASLNAQNVLGGSPSEVKKYMKKNFKETLIKTKFNGDTLIYYFPERTCAFLISDGICSYCFFLYDNLSLYQNTLDFLEENYKYQPDVKLGVSDALEERCFYQKFGDFDHLVYKWSLIKYKDYFAVTIDLQEIE